MTCSFKSGEQFGIGKTDVLCEAIDGSGNRATCAFTINVAGKVGTVYIIRMCGIKLIPVTTYLQIDCKS